MANFTLTSTGAIKVSLEGADHGMLAGLTDDDHTQYLLADGSRALTGNLSASAGVTVDGYDVSNLTVEHNSDGTHAAVTATSLTVNGNMTFTAANAAIKYPRDLWLRENAWASGDYMNFRGGGSSGNETVSLLWHDSSAGTNTTILTLRSSTNVIINGTSSSGQLTVNAADATTVGAVFNNYASTTANIAEFKVDGVDKFVIGSGGAYTYQKTDTHSESWAASASTTENIDIDVGVSTVFLLKIDIGGYGNGGSGNVSGCFLVAGHSSSSGTTSINTILNSVTANGSMAVSWLDNSHIRVAITNTHGTQPKTGFIVYSVSN